MKTKNVATLRLRKSSGHSLVRRGFVLLVLALTCFALSTPALAKKKKKKTPPTPTGIIHSTRLFVEGNNPIDTANFTGLSLQYSSGPGEGAIMSSFNDGASVLTFYTKNGPGQPITQRMIIDENGNVGIGSADPQRLLQIGPDTNALFTLEGTDGTPNAGYLRFGDNTGWKLHFGRSRESSAGALNTGTLGTIMTVQDNGNVGIGTTVPVAQLQVEGFHLISGGSTPSLSTGFYKGPHLEMDMIGIQAGDGAPASSHPSTLSLNSNGGNINIGSTGYTTRVFGTFVNISDRDIKEDFAPVNAQAVLDQLQTLPLSTWKYKGPDARRHIGPMAQDFHGAFDRLLDLKSDDKTIAPLDEAGVAFAAIQALQVQVTARDGKIAEQEKQIRVLAAAVTALEARDQAREARLTRLENNGPARAVNAVLALK